MTEKEALELRTEMFNKHHIVHNIYFCFHQFSFIAQLESDAKEFGNENNSNYKHLGTDYKDVLSWLKSLPEPEDENLISDDEFRDAMGVIIESLVGNIKQKN